MSALITRMRTEKIGLNAFLVEGRLPGYSPGCPCGFQRQTAKHIIMHCPSYIENRDGIFQAAGTWDYKKMLATICGAKAAAHFLQRTVLAALAARLGTWSWRHHLNSCVTRFRARTRLHSSVHNTDLAHTHLRRCTEITDSCMPSIPASIIRDYWTNSI